MKKLIALCAIGFLLTVGGVASAVSVESGGFARLEYTISPLPGNATYYQHTHAEAGFDVATGAPIMVKDDYGQPASSAYASTTHSWGEATGDTGATGATTFLGAENYASAGSSALQSWGYGSAVHRVDFTLSASETIDIDYIFSGKVWVDSQSPAGSGFSVGLAAIEIDGVLVYDSDPGFTDYVEVIGIGSQEKFLSDSGTISLSYAVGQHEIAFFVDTYENAIVPEPMTMLAVGMAVAGLGGYIRKRRMA